MKKIRAVNLGGWFVLEKWMKPSLLNDNFVDGNDETNERYEGWNAWNVNFILK